MLHTTCTCVFVSAISIQQILSTLGQHLIVVVEMISETNDLVFEANDLRNLPNQLQLQRANERDVASCCEIVIWDQGCGLWDLKAERRKRRSDGSKVEQLTGSRNLLR